MNLPAAPGGRVYLRLSLTDRCNLRCRYCRPVEPAHSAKHTEFVNESELIELVRLIHEGVGLHKLRFSGGEPLMYRGTTALVGRLRKRLPEVTFGMTTNGTLLARSAVGLRHAGLDSVNVSLDSLDPHRFRSITVGGDLAATLQGISAAIRAGLLSVKINTVLVRGTNGDQLPGLVRFAASLGCEIRFIELMPFGHGAELYRTDYLGADEAIDLLSRAFDYVSGAPATSTANRHRFLVDGRIATVGFITPVSHPFCSRCDRLRLTREGRLYPCLRQSTSVDLITPLRAGDETEIRKRIRGSLCGKKSPGQHWPERQMVTIGG